MALEGCRVFEEMICQTTFRSLMIILRRCSEKAKMGRDWPWRFLYWPLFLAAMETSFDLTLVDERPWLLNAFYSISQRQAEFSLLDAADFFGHIWGWEVTYGGPGTRTWDDLVTPIDGQALFFV